MQGSVHTNGMCVGECYVQEFTPLTTLNVPIKSSGIHTSLGHRTHTVRKDRSVIAGNSHFAHTLNKAAKHAYKTVPSDIYVNSIKLNVSYLAEVGRASVRASKVTVRPHSDVS